MKRIVIKCNLYQRISARFCFEGLIRLENEINETKNQLCMNNVLSKFLISQLFFKASIKKNEMCNFKQLTNAQFLIPILISSWLSVPKLQNAIKTGSTDNKTGLENYVCVFMRKFCSRSSDEGRKLRLAYDCNFPLG